MIRRILARIIARDFQADQRNQKLVAIGASAVLPTLLGVWGAATPDLWKSSGPWLVASVWIILIVFQAVLAWRLLDRPVSMGIILQTLGETEVRAEDANRALAVATQAAKQANFVQSWLLTAYPLLSTTPDDVPLDQHAAGRIFDPLFSDPLALFGLSPADIWSFALYLYDPASNMLRCHWRHCDPRHPSAGQTPREWPPGAGHIGVAFQNPSYRSGHRGLLTPDAGSEAIRAVFDAPADRLRDYDRGAYRSFASIPFGSFDEAKPSRGVVVGTSSEPGAFTELSALPLRHLAMLLTARARSDRP